MPHAGRPPELTPFDRWMVFVDGENFTIRGQRLLSDRGVPVEIGTHFQKNRYLWAPGASAEDLIKLVYAHRASGRCIRAHYYIGLHDGDDQDGARDSILSWGFQPSVFRRTVQKGSKGVDIAMATDMLSHAVDDNYDACILVAGDEDYVPLVEAVARRGKAVVAAFFESTGSAAELKRVADRFIPIDGWLLHAWFNRTVKVEKGLGAFQPRGDRAAHSARILSGPGGLHCLAFIPPDGKVWRRVDLEPGDLNDEGHPRGNMYHLFDRAVDWRPY